MSTSDYIWRILQLSRNKWKCLMRNWSHCRIDKDYQRADSLSLSAPLNFPQIWGGPESTSTNFFTLIQTLKLDLAIKIPLKRRLQESFLSYKLINLKLRVFQMVYSFAIIIYVKWMATTCSPMFGHLFDTTIATSMGGGWPPDRQVWVWALVRGIVFFDRILYSRSASLHPGV